MRADHPLASTPLTLDHFCLARHILVSFSGRPWGFVDEALQALNRERHIALTVNQFFTAARVAAQTELLTVMPRHFIHTTGVATDLVERELPVRIPLVHVDALWHRRQHGAPAHRWLRETMVRSAADAYGRSLREYALPYG